MDWARVCMAVIPCFNEARAVGQVVTGVRPFLDRVLVVDDGSTDATSRVARDAGAQVLRHEQHLGKGAALTTGLRAAREQGFAWALIMDGDGQHPASSIPQFFEAGDRGRFTLVAGDRTGQIGAMTGVRRLANRWMSRALSRLAGRPLPDTQCGFRLVQLEAWARLPHRTRHFQVESEMLLAFVEAGEAVGFVPVPVRAALRPSRIRPVPDTWRWLRWWWGARRRARSRTLPVGPRWRRAAWGAARFLVVATLLGWFYGWAAPVAYPVGREVGFGHGMLHGALMPMALPSLVLGQDVPIYATQNRGRPYKLGYIVGINACGLIVFGSAFWNPRSRGTP